MGFFQLIRAAAIGWWNDRAMSLGASIAFFTLFSLAPMLLLAISVVGLAYGREAAQGAVVGELGGLLGKDAAAALEALIASARDVGSGVIGTAVGVVTFLVVATGAVSEIQDNLNIIWKVQGSSFSLWSVLRTRVLSLALVLGIGFLLLVSLLVDAAISVIATYIEAGFSEGLAVLQLLNSVASFLVATLLFAMIFKILPAVALAWRDVAAGAAVTGLLFTVGKVLIGLYIGQSGIASGYGAAASVITIMLWIYYSSLILLFGAEFTKAFAETRGSHAR
ncbi:YihY/virulence factor BrkB family protein [Rubellimicrobium arenae]|uniref:YihY/virulence factor BrkB family protein n=1 Tax=Rubellimicrobium arenae TaxID=2817372 RepID=UPI001B3051F1|nr:YihY/virulence factor BrkB family protein [Rubellimicrobium arenae]